jgi:hypothetical protein
MSGSVKSNPGGRFGDGIGWTPLTTLSSALKALLHHRWDAVKGVPELGEKSQVKRVPPHFSSKTPWSHIAQV